MLYNIGIEACFLAILTIIALETAWPLFVCCAHSLLENPLMISIKMARVRDQYYSLTRLFVWNFLVPRKKQRVNSTRHFAHALSFYSFLSQMVEHIPPEVPQLLTRGSTCMCVVYQTLANSQQHD